MNPVVIRYPLDLTGRHPDNLVVGERHGPCGPGNRVFVPNYGPYYSKSLVVKNAATGNPLTPGMDYKAIQTFIEPTQMTGELVCSIVMIEPSAYGIEVEIEYQVLGGDFSLSTTALEQMLEDLADDNRPVHWGEIIGKPTAFPPTPHMHDVNDVFGWQYVVAALEAIRRAILLGDVSSEEDFYAYVDMKFAQAMAEIAGVSEDLLSHISDFNNPHRVTKDQLGLGNVGNYGLSTPEIAALNLSNETLITPFTAKYAVDFHTSDRSNPHGVTKQQVGLGNVDDYITATLQMAIDGTDDASFITPYKMRAAWAEWTGGVTPNPTSPPVSKFTISGERNVPAGTNPVLTFTNTSTDGSSPIATYLWNFGNGTTSTVRNPPAVTYTFPEETRAYVISLKVADADGLNNTSTQSVTLIHTQQQVPPTGMVLRANGTPTTGSNYGSVKEVAPEVSSAPHPIDWTISAPTAGVGPYTYLWNATTIEEQRGASYGTLPGTGWTQSGTMSVSKSPSIPNYDPALAWVQTVSCTVTSQANGLANSVSTYVSYKTIALKRPIAAFSLSTSGLVGPGPNLSATFANDSSLNGSDLNWNASQWTFTSTSGTCSPGSQTVTGAPQPQSVTIISPAVGSGTLSVNLIVTTAPSDYQDTRTQHYTYTRQPPTQQKPTAAVSYTVGFEIPDPGAPTVGVTKLSVTNMSAAGTSPIVSYDWSVVWDYGGVQTSTARQPPAFYSITGRHGASLVLKVTDSNGLSDTVSRIVPSPA